MNIDFLHNQIIRDTITPKFIESFNDNLVPYLMSEYGSSLDEVQFYEDHLSSGLRIGGEFYYPLTVVVAGEPTVRCVSWQVSNYRNYDKFNPFSYKGREPLEFTLLDEIPDAVKAAIKNKSFYAKSGVTVPVSVTFAGDDKTFLSGKYSQGFIDLLAKSMTEIIEGEFGISGLASSGVVIEISYAPGTFMEHIVGNTTYRRALILARGCAPRDLWIKWTRLDGFGTYTVSDNVTEDEIEFALAEDVSGKIREKEYRYLTSGGVDKYQAAMSRKNITEWRDVMRRVIRRGEVTKLESEGALTLTAPETEDVVVNAVPDTYKEPEIVSDIPAVDEFMSMLDKDDEPDNNADYDDELSALLKSAIGLTSGNKIVEPEIEDIPETAVFDEVVEEIADEEVATAEAEPVAATVPEDGFVRIAPTANSAAIDEERIRYEIEQRVRAEMEAELARKAREAEELRVRLEEKLRAEAREKELLAEAARAAIVEQQRLAKEREEREKREAEEREAAARREAEERAERARREAEAKAKAEAEARAKAEAEARAREEAQRKAEEANYVSKKVKLIFKHQIDQSITARIHEIIVATIKYYHKEDVYIKIKATIPDITTVNLEFVKIPENEVPLIVNIIKVLGRSDLGITRATLD